MSKALIYQPFGLGDHLICNGLVRELARTHSHIGLFATPQYVASVTAFFRDLPHLTVIPVASHTEAEAFIATHVPRTYDHVVRVGAPDAVSGIVFERQFYQSAGVPFTKKWSSFHIPPDPEREEYVRRTLAPEDAFQFIHDDGRFPLDLSRVNPTLPTVRPDFSVTQNLSDYRSILIEARELHVIDSSFMFLIDGLVYDAPHQKLFLHRYARPNIAMNLPVLYKHWEILT